ncbi:MAG: glycosyltransferase [Elusimicrobiota bacterium]
MSSGASSLSVIILASRPRSLSRCLESLVEARLPQDFECLLLLNGNEEACAAAATPYLGRLRGLKVLSGAPRSLGDARNAAVARAQGGWLCFLDDDVTVPQDYFSVLGEKILRYPEAAVIGGPNLTPPQSPPFERCVGRLLSSRLCAGPMSRRFGGFPADTWTDESGLILCNLAIRREALAGERPPFDPELVRNEENLLLERLARVGRRALHAPELYVHHERRSTVGAFCRQCFLSGQGRAQMSLKLPSSLRLLHLAPLLPLLGLFGLCARPFLFFPLAAVYVFSAAVNAAALSLRRFEGGQGLAWLFLLHPLAHLSYAAGLFAGLAAGRYGRRSCSSPLPSTTIDSFSLPIRSSSS